MASVSEGLSKLHKLLNTLKDVGDRLSRGPRQIKLREQQVELLRQELVNREADLKQTRATADKKNLELRSKESHLADLQVKLNQASSNREYDIIKGQVAADQAAKAVLEDEIIEALERVDLVQKSIADAKADIAKAEKDIQEFAKTFESQIGTLKEQEMALQVQIADAQTVIPTTLAAEFRRLVSAHGADALAEVSGGVCSHCYVNLTPQNRVRLNSGETLFCNCGRLLYVAAKD